jgi:hypothetical protein
MPAALTVLVLASAAGYKPLLWLLENLFLSLKSLPLVAKVTARAACWRHSLEWVALAEFIWHSTAHQAPCFNLHKLTHLRQHGVFRLPFQAVPCFTICSSASTCERLKWGLGGPSLYRCTMTPQPRSRAAGCRYGAICWAQQVKRQANNLELWTSACVMTVDHQIKKAGEKHHLCCGAGRRRTLMSMGQLCQRLLWQIQLSSAQRST